MACSICGCEETLRVGEASDWYLQTTKTVFRMSQCKHCQSYFLDPLPTKQDLMEAYPKQYWWDSKDTSSGNSLLSRYRILGATKLADWIDKVGGKKNLSVVELGSGIGTTLWAGREKYGWKVMGFDTSKEASKKAEETYNLEVKVGNLEEAIPDLGQFDVVLLSHVLEHLYDPDALIRKIRACMNTNAKLIVLVPNAKSLGVKVFGLKWRGFDVPRHLVTFSPKGLETLLKRNGFTVAGRGIFSFRDDAPHLSGSLLPSWDPVVAKTRNDSLSLPASIGFGVITLLLQPVAYLSGLFAMGETLNLVALPSE